MELKSIAPPQNFIYLDEAGFNLAKGRRCGWNVVSQRGIVNVSGQQGGKTTVSCYLRAWCANLYSNYRAIQHTASPHLLRHPLRGSHPWWWEGLIRDDSTKYMLIWNNMSFHHSNTTCHIGYASPIPDVSAVFFCLPVKLIFLLPLPALLTIKSAF